VLNLFWVYIWVIFLPYLLFISSSFLSKIHFSNNQMVNTRSGGGQDIASTRRAHIVNQQNPLPPSPPNPTMEQFLAAQMQLLQNLTATVANMQAQQNQQAPPTAPQPRDKHRDFMSHHPPTYSHSVDPLDADDWLMIITKKLDITQCTDRERVLYASGHLEGSAADWWDAYTTAHADVNTITWEEFRNNFREHHIPVGVTKLKQKEFLALMQGNMSVSEYRDKFTQLSRYAPNDVDTDAKRHDHFFDGLIGPLNYQLQSHTFPNLQTLFDKAIGLESKRKEMGEQKRKFPSQG